MVNLRFPDTDIVTCVFSLKNSAVTGARVFDQNDMVQDPMNAGLKEYSYRVPQYLQGKLTSGDFVVVHCQTGYQLCQVSRINAFCATESNKLAPVIAKVDLNEYFNDLIRQEELKRMHAALVKERKRLEEQVTWDLIAEKSPEFAVMLKAYRDAGGEL